MDRINPSKTSRTRRAAAELMLQDEQHRTANELSSALAALKLTVRDHEEGSLRFVESAIKRLEGFVAVRRILASPEERGCDIVECLRDLAIAMEQGRSIPGGIALTTCTLTVRVVPDLARTILNLAHEMLTNAMKHGSGAHEILLSIRFTRRSVLLRCENSSQACGIGRKGGGGLRIMRALCRTRGGAFSYSSGEDGFHVLARLPRLPRPDV